ncbi:DciA family protein [Pseudomonas sp. F1_0610]|uniref:DciA family protein n=1 Tax=Pseudomonas sp. F1_0610 TaxID=3114284 RepID=UPI0039C14E7E
MTKLPHPAQSSASILKKHYLLKPLVSQAARHHALQTALQQQLPAAAREFCFLASWQNQHITILVTQAMWATRLRFLQTHLLADLQKVPEFAGVLGLKFKIIPKTQKHQPKRQAPTLSEGAAKVIQANAQIIQNEDLRAALERLASRAQKP